MKTPKKKSTRGRKVGQWRAAHEPTMSAADHAMLAQNGAFYAKVTAFLATAVALTRARAAGQSVAVATMPKQLRVGVDHALTLLLDAVDSRDGRFFHELAIRASKPIPDCPADPVMDALAQALFLNKTFGEIGDNPTVADLQTVVRNRTGQTFDARTIRRAAATLGIALRRGRPPEHAVK